jgi:chlorite dismutase
MIPDTLAATAMPPLPLSVEGASVLHQMMRFRRPAWRALSDGARAQILHEASGALAALERPAEGRQSALFSLLGHKGDLLFIHFRRSFSNQVQLIWRVALSDYLDPRLPTCLIMELA